MAVSRADMHAELVASAALPSAPGRSPREKKGGLHLRRHVRERLCLTLDDVQHDVLAVGLGDDERSGLERVARSTFSTWLRPTNRPPHPCRLGCVSIDFFFASDANAAGCFRTFARIWFASDLLATAISAMSSWSYWSMSFLYSAAS